ncbi:MAG: LptE family protein [Ignavibacteriaceae bacterium]|nr:LptE family protein [Ignavibacteriaceae bacterium]
MIGNLKTIVQSRWFYGLFFTYYLFNFTGCSGCPYSFSGASVPPHLKTIAIPFTEDRSGSSEGGLRELFNTQLTQKFINDNNLAISDRTNADAILETAIVSFSDLPAVVTGGETLASRKVSITVQVVYRDLVKKKVIFERQFSNYGDYASGGGLAERTKGIETAVDRITDDILLETVSGW